MEYLEIKNHLESSTLFHEVYKVDPRSDPVTNLQV